MAKILVTGATGNIGRMTLEQLLKRKPPSELVGLARDPGKAVDLAAKGIEIRQGDYFDHDGLVRAFEGVEKVMLVSTTAFTDRNIQHENVVNAARHAGVRHIVYMPIIRKPGSGLSLPQITNEDVFVEELIAASGMDYTLVGHPPFLENIPVYVGGNPFEAGVVVPHGSGRAGYASRRDLAEAHAAVLTGSGHENRSYMLRGAPAVSFADVAQIYSEIGDREVPLHSVSDQEYVARLVATGVPELAADFVLTWVRAVNTGEWDGPADDLENLLGRKPTTVAESLRSNHAQTLPKVSQ